MSNPGPELFKAMLAFQATNPSVAKGGNNPHFRSKYITLEDLTSVARACNQHGLVFWHHQVDEEGTSYEVTTLAHAESGQCIETRVKLLFGKNDSQGQGSAKTYARRYGLAGLLALCDCKDDDGEAAMTSSGHRGGDNNVPFDSGVQDDLRTPKAKAAREHEEAAVTHHPSWERHRKLFHTILGQLNVDYYELCDWLSTKNPPLNKRPSEMDEHQRQRLTDFLCGDRGLHQFLNWKEER